jgi:hypothetical protein
MGGLVLQAAIVLTHLAAAASALQFELGPEVVQPQLSAGPSYQFPDAALAFLREPRDGTGADDRLMFPSDGKTYRTTGRDLTHRGSPDPPGEVLGAGPNNTYDMNGNWMLAAFRIGGPRSSQLVGFTHVENHRFNCSGPYAEWNAAAVVRSSDDGRSWSRDGLAVGDPQPCQPRFGGSGYSSVLRRQQPARPGAPATWRGWGGCYGYASVDPTGAAGTWTRYCNGVFSEPVSTQLLIGDPRCV